MTIAIWMAGIGLVAMIVLHIVSILIAIARCKHSKRLVAPPPAAPAVSIIRPVCGIENHIEATLASAFELDYPNYEIIFCAALADDPIIPVIHDLMKAYPRIKGRLLIGNERISSNPKLNNVFKGWSAAEHDWVLIADSNVLMPRDYIQRLLLAWRPKTGLVCSPPVGCRPEGIWAELECGFLNTYQARWQYVADSVGLGFAQGKTMLWRRADLEHAGGIGALGAEIAEDADATKVVRGAGRQVRLVDGPFDQPLGSRKWDDVWCRQIRWARLRHATFKSYFFMEVTAGILWPVLTTVFVAAAMERSIPISLAILLAAWYGAEIMLARAAGWHLSLRSPAIWLLRDLLLPALWLEGWRGSDFVWRGHHMDALAGNEAIRQVEPGPI